MTDSKILTPPPTCYVPASSAAARICLDQLREELTKVERTPFAAALVVPAMVRRTIGLLDGFDRRLAALEAAAQARP